MFGDAQNIHVQIELEIFWKGTSGIQRIILLFLSAFMLIFVALRYACNLYLSTPTKQESEMILCFFEIRCREHAEIMAKCAEEP